MEEIENWVITVRRSVRVLSLERVTLALFTAGASVAVGRWLIWRAKRPKSGLAGSKPMIQRRYAVVGDAFVDVLASGVMELPAWNSDALTAHPICLKTGGSAMNTAIHLHELSSQSVELHTAIASDAFGSFLRDEAKARGVGLVVHDAPSGLGTGSCVVISGERDRTFITYRGVIDALRGSAIDASGCNHLHLAGFYNCRGLQADAGAIFRSARAAGCTTSLGVQHDATGTWGKVGRPPLTTDDAAPDFLFLSEDEARHIVSKIVPNDDPSKPWPRADALALLASGAARCIVLTVGAKGAILATHDTQRRAIILEQCAVNLDRFVDATGAGDAFAAGFIFGFKQFEGSLRAALKHGCAAGATCVANVGASQALSSTIFASALNKLDLNSPLAGETDLVFDPLRSVT